MTRRGTFSVLALIAALLLLGAGSAQASPGALDTTFGTGGEVVTKFGSDLDYGIANAVALQADGRIVAGGVSSQDFEDLFTLARYNADGSFDTSFGTGGTVTTELGVGAAVTGMAQQPDGKIVAAGYSDDGVETGFALARYNANGSLDTAFGTGGEVLTTSDAGDLLGWAVALQPDGKIVVAGELDGDETDFALARYNADGSLDASFGTGGMITTSLGDSVYGAKAVVLQPNGKIVAAGWGRTADQDVFALARYNADGSLDESFGTGGKVMTAVEASGGAGAVALQPDGKIVAAGGSSDGTVDHFALVRYTANGSLDTSFGTQGIVTTAINAHAGANGLALQSDGEIVAAGGSASNAVESDTFALARYKKDGSLDTSFGTGGTITTSIGPRSIANAVAIQSDGKIVGVGQSWNTQDIWQFTLARYSGTNPSPPPPPPPPTGTQHCVVPKLEGHTLAAAEKAIKAANCSVGRISKAYSAKVRKGRVIAQAPRAGVQETAGAAVKLTLSKGKRKRR